MGALRTQPRFFKTEHSQLVAWVRKPLYDTYDQPNVEILMGQRSEIEKIVDFGSRGRRKSSLSIRFPWHPLRKQVVSRKPLKLDIPGRKVLCSAFQDTTSVKISTKSEHLIDQMWDSRILESEAPNKLNRKISAKFSDCDEIFTKVAFWKADHKIFLPGRSNFDGFRGTACFLGACYENRIEN